MLKGLFPPIPTPFEKGEVSLARLADNIARWNDWPLDGYVVLGSNGEAPLLDDDERAKVIAAARTAASSSRTIIAGAGRESTRATIRAVGEAFTLGVDAVLVGVPAYFKPQMTREALREHYLRVADASPGPVLLYSVPVFTGIPIEPGLFGELLSHERVAGIKDSSGDGDNVIALVEAARNAGRPDASVLAGSLRSLVAGMAAGAQGAILGIANVAGIACAEILKASRDGESDRAHAAAVALTPLADAVTRRHGVAGLKAALDYLGFFGGEPRSPLLPASAAVRAEIAALIESSHIQT